jgi:hypothetical protein
MEFVADSVDPLLGLLAVYQLWRLGRERRLGFALATLGAIALLAAFNQADRALGWWRAMDLDFSMHTAVGVSLVTSLVVVDRRWILVGLPILIGYGFLMDHLGFHGWGDFLTSAPVAIAFTLACHALVWRYRRARTASTA